MNSIILEFVRVALRYVLVLLAAYGAPDALVQAVGSEQAATWAAGLVIAGITETGWIKARLAAWKAKV